jgi:predicted RNA methylase
MGQAATAITRRIGRAFRRNGLSGFIKLCFRNLATLAAGRWKDHAYVYDVSFDRKHGVETAGVVEVDELVADRASKASAQRYEATPPECFSFLVAEAGIGRPGDYSFVDLGSGKGRVLLLAALAGFRSVTGVELCENLHQVASANISRSRGLAVLPKAILADATSYDFPPEPTLCFLNNPFGPQILQRTLENIERSLRDSPRDFRLIYYHCNHAGLVDARKDWHCVSRGHWQNPAHRYAIYQWRGQERTQPLSPEDNGL